MTNSDSHSITPAEARRAARNAGAIAAASILSKGLLFGWQLILARAIGEAQYGVYGTIGAFIAVGTALVNFGMGPIVIRDVAREPRLAGKYLAATLIMQSALALLTYGLVNVSAALGGYERHIQALLALAALSLLVDILGNMTNDLLLAQERMLATSLVSIGHILVLVVLAALVLSQGFGLAGVYLATIITGAGRALILWLLVLSSGIRPQLPLERRVALPLLLNGAPLAIAAFLSLAYQHADKLMTTRFIGTAQTGYLTAAFVIVFGVIELLNTTILIAVYPLMSRYSQTGETFGFIVEKLSFFTVLVSVPIALVLSIFSTEITVPLFGPNFLPTAQVLQILIWYTAAAMTANIFAQAMIIQNRQRRLLLLRAAGLLVNITLNALLIPRLQIFGAAAASLAAELLILTVMVWGFRAAGWRWQRTFPRLLRLLALSITAALTMLLLGRLHPMLGLAGGSLLYAGGIASGLVLSREDWDLIYRLVAAMPGGAIIRKYWQRDVALNW